jgi:hypothetical protein
MLSEREWRRLVETVRRGNCVLVLGSDVALDPDDTTGLPLSSRLAEQLAADLGQPPSDPHDLPLVAQTYLREPDRDRYDLEIDTRDFYARYLGQTTAVHRHLAALPFSLCLTTTPEDFMAEAFRQQSNKQPTSEFYDFSDPGRRPVLVGGVPERPIVYRLFGSLDRTQSLVLAESELLDFLVTLVRGSSGLPDYIAGELGDKGTAFLFLGFGFQRWYTRILLHVLQAYKHPTRSLAIEGETFFAHPEQARTALFFEQASSIVFCQQDWEQFAAELHRRFDATAAPPPADDAALNTTTAPKVFLCHDSRDREQVTTLERQLNSLGVNTWRDAQELRGGDDWDRRIEHVLRKQVDYVLVCETPGMVSKGESYLHKEIKVALARQQQFPIGQRFILPATLAAGAGFAHLDRLHRADLTTITGVVALAHELLDDWTARRTAPGEQP